MSNPIDLAYVEKSLAQTPFFGNLHHFASVGSTNQLALEAAQAGAPHGSVWIADEQTAGRGRGGHQWHSTAGDGLYLSALLRPAMPLNDALWISLATALAVQAAILQLAGVAPDIRWPNDLLLGEKKCGGILVETSAIPAPRDGHVMLRYAVIGIGINVNHESFPPELQALATSVRLETGVAWSRGELIVLLLRALEQQLAWLEAEQNGRAIAQPLLERFAGASGWVSGKRVSVDEAGGYTGVTEGLDERGFLRVEGDDGVLHTVLSGGVRAG